MVSELRMCVSSFLKSLLTGVTVREPGQELACRLVVREGFLEEEASGGGGRWVSQDAQDRQGAGTEMRMGSEEQRVGVEPEGQRGPPPLSGWAATAGRSKALMLCPRVTLV